MLNIEVTDTDPDRCKWPSPRPHGLVDALRTFSPEHYCANKTTPQETSRASIVQCQGPPTKTSRNINSPQIHEFSETENSKEFVVERIASNIYKMSGFRIVMRFDTLIYTIAKRESFAACRSCRASAIAAQIRGG